MTLILTVVLVALIFEYINGFHDTANAIATTVSTKVMRPFEAVIFSAIFNLLGALAGTAVVTTIGKGLVDTSVVTLTTILCALISGIGWNLLTWWIGLPSSSSHALVGGLCGAALATAAGGWRIIHTMGSKVVRIQKVHGFTAQTAAAGIIQLASNWESRFRPPTSSRRRSWASGRRKASKPSNGASPSACCGRGS